MFSIPRQRPGPLIAHQLRALEAYRRALAYAELEAAAKRTVRHTGTKDGWRCASRPKRIYEWLLANKRGDSQTIREALGMTQDEFRNAAAKLCQKSGMIKRKRRGFYELV